MPLACRLRRPRHGALFLCVADRWRHQTLRVTPAMEAGVSDHIWSLDEVIALL